MSAVTIKDGIHWIGIQDPDLRVFDVVMETEFGTSYNSYILKTPQYTVLFETVKRKWMPKFIENMKEVCNPEEIDYIVIDHTEPDHAGSLEDLLDLAPNAKVIGSSVALNFLSNICNREIPGIAVGDDDEIKLDTCTLKFLSVPFLHWPDSIYTYIPEKQTLVTCDSFGCHYADDRVCNDLIDGEFVPAYKYYFDMIMGPFKSHVRYALDRIKDLDFTTICPGHGPVLRENLDFYLGLYEKWSDEPAPEKREKPKVVGAYVAAYGYTEELAHTIKESILEEIDADIDLYDMVYADHDKVLAEMASADGILAGTPTVNGDALPPVTNLLMSMNGILHGGKVAGAFGSYGWSGEGADMLNARLKVLRMNTVEPPLKSVFKPGVNDLANAKKFGKKFAKKLKEEWVKMGTDSDGKTYWKCTVCGEVFEGALPPLTCPVCGAGQEAFIEEFPEVVSYAEDTDKSIVIIGSGAAAVATAESIRKRDKTAKIEIYSRETVAPYYRPFLTKNMVQEATGEDFYLKSDQFYKDNNIGLNLGCQVTDIDKSAKTITVSGKTVNFDKLVIATGASSFVPPVKGVDLANVLTLREKSDRDTIFGTIEKIKENKKVVEVAVMGGGLLGLEAAYSLSQLGCKVTVLEACPTILPRQMDADGAPLLREAISKSTVKVKTGTFVEEVCGAGKVEAIITRAGEKIKADMLIISAGIKSNTSLANEAGLETCRGIVVNKTMQTSDSDIYAVGDCAEIDGNIVGLWDAAVSQGRVAGANIVGDEKEYEAKTLGATLHAFDVQLFSIGDLGFDEKAVYQTSMNRDEINNTYKKLYFKDGLLVGGILFGDVFLTNALVTGVTKQITIEDAKDSKLL